MQSKKFKIKILKNNPLDLKRWVCVSFFSGHPDFCLSVKESQAYFFNDNDLNNGRLKSFLDNHQDYIKVYN